MAKHMLWIIWFLPIVIAFPAEDSVSTDSSENRSLQESKLPNLEELLHAYDIPNLESLSTCRSKHAYCPFVEDELLQFVEDLCKMHNYVPQASTGILKDSAIISSSQDMNSLEYIPPSGKLDAVKSKLENEVTSASMIYLFLWTYGSSLQREQVQRFNEFYTAANKTFMNYFQTFNSTLNDDGREQLAIFLNEKTTIDARFNLINKEIESNLTKQEDQLNIITTDIQSQNYLIAIKKFLKLDDHELLSTIVGKILNQNATMEKTEKLLKFIKKLQSRDDRFIGYNAMLKTPNLGYSIFTLEHDYNTPESSIFLLDPISNEPIIQRKHWKDEAVFKLKLQELVEELVTQTALNLMWKDLKFILYLNDQEEPFSAHLEEIVEKVFEDKNDNSNLDYERGVENLLYFADNLSHIPLSARVYIKLMKILELKYKNYFKFQLKIARQVYQLTLMKNYKNTSQEVQKGLEELKAKLQPAVNSIIWRQVCIKNQNSGGFLHRNDRCDSSRRNVIITQEADLWQFESINGEDAFKIRHVETGEYLFTTNGSLVYTGLEDDSNFLDQSWSVGILNYKDYVTNPTNFYIKNEALTQFLGFKERSDGFVTCKDAFTEKVERMDTFSQHISPPNTYRNYKYGNINEEWYFINSTDC